jgi:hypothetical protein
MIDSKTREANFRRELEALLEKHGVEMEIEYGYGYMRIEVNLGAVYDEESEPSRNLQHLNHD